MCPSLDSLAANLVDGLKLLIRTMQFVVCRLQLLSDRLQLLTCRDPLAGFGVDCGYTVGRLVGNT
jgi:hypothetical protein